MSERAERRAVADWANDFDHFDPAFVSAPDRIWSELREGCPVAHSDRYGGLNVVTRWEDVQEVARDTATFSSRRVLVNEVPTTHRGLPLPPINLDPPLHTDRRRVLLPFFSPRGVERWEATIREICREALDALAGRAEADLAVDYAQVIPAELTARMLGLRAEDVPMFRQWLHDLLEVGPTDVELLARTTHTMQDYLAALVAERRVTGGDDVVTYLLEQRIEGEPLTDDELVNMVFLLLVAGIDTTWSAIGFSLLHLATHPEDRHRLAGEPSLVPTAVEELLRYYPPVWVARVATTDTAVGGCPVAAGEWVVMGIPAANRDPSVYDAPEDVVIDRLPNRHAAFGLGVHRCLGSNLARLELAIAVQEWLARFPEFELADGGAVEYSAGQIRGPRKVPARLGP
jgi:cytochrome P450